MTIERVIEGVSCYYDREDHEWRDIENGYKLIPKTELFKAYNIVVEHLMFMGADERLINLLLSESDKILPNKED